LTMRGPAFSRLPSVDQVLKSASGQLALSRFGHRQTIAAIREQIARMREDMRAGIGPSGVDAAANAALAALEAASVPRARPVFNLTGTVLHTNLGRALLAEEAILAAKAAMRSPVALEYDLATGKRGQRDDLLRHLLIELTGAEDAT